MKNVTVDEAKAQFDELVAQVESTGDEVVLTRSGMAVARLVREPERYPELTPEEIEKRREAIANMRAVARSLGGGLTHDEIKESINHGRRC